MNVVPLARRAAGFVPSARRLWFVLLGVTMGVGSVRADQPIITSISPGSGRVGSTVIIRGSGFAAPLTIRFKGGGGTGSFDATQIEAIVPPDAQTGPITVTTAGGAVSSDVFYVLADQGPGAYLRTTSPNIVLNDGSESVATITASLRNAASRNTTLNYRVGGSAVNGKDYRMLTGQVVVRAGTTSKNIKIRASGDLDGASKRTVKLTLLPGTGYTVEDHEPPAKVKIFVAGM